MARKNLKERQKKVEDSEDISADSEPDQEVDAPEVQTVSSESKESEAEDEATTNSEEDQTDKEDKKKKSDPADKKRRKRKTEAHHPPTIDMVLDALMYLDNKKGVTIPAMKDYILTQNTVRPEHLKHLLRRALVTLMEKESIIRPKGEENKSVLLGRYKIAPKKDVKPEKPRERPASLRKLGGAGGKVKKSKKKKRKRMGFY